MKQNRTYLLLGGVVDDLQGDKNKDLRRTLLITGLKLPRAKKGKRRHSPLAGVSLCPEL